MIGYIRYGNIWQGIPIYIIVMRKEPNNGWFVEILPCDMYGHEVSDPIAWDHFGCWWNALGYFIHQYLEFYKYVNMNL